jgi:hypothetical protein
MSFKDTSKMDWGLTSTLEVKNLCHLTEIFIAK